MMKIHRPSLSMSMTKKQIEISASSATAADATVDNENASNIKCRISLEDENGIRKYKQHMCA